MCSLVPLQAVSQRFHHILSRVRENTLHRLWTSTSSAEILRLREFIRKRMNHSAQDDNSRVLALHLREQLLNPIFFLDCSEPVFDVVSAKFRLGLAHGFVVRDFTLHTVEGSAF